MLYEYDVTLSFAGEDREYVDQVANILKKNDINVFYDKFEVSKLWGEDLYTYLSDIYSEKAQYTVIFCSKSYSKNLWTNHERKSAQARAFRENESYILPARFDDTKIPGILETTGYIDLRGTSPQELCQRIAEKLKKDSSKRIIESITTTKKFFKNKNFSKAIDVFNNEIGNYSAEDVLYYILSLISKVKVSSLKKLEVQSLYSLIDGISEKDHLTIFDYLWLIIFYENTNKNMTSRSMDSRKNVVQNRVLSKELKVSEKKLFKDVFLVTREAKILIR